MSTVGQDFHGKSHLSSQEAAASLQASPSKSDLRVDTVIQPALDALRNPSPASSQSSHSSKGIKASKVKFANNEYILAVGAFYRGDTTRARKILNKLAEEASKLDHIKIDVEASLRTMFEKIRNNPYIDLPLRQGRATSKESVRLRSKLRKELSRSHEGLEMSPRSVRLSDLEKRSGSGDLAIARNIKKEENHAQKTRERLSSPLKERTSPSLLHQSGSVPDLQALDLSLNVQTLGLHDLSLMSSRSIFSQSISIPMEKLRSEGFRISYGNVGFGGAAPDIKLKFTMSLDKVEDPSTCLRLVNDVATKYGMNPITDLSQYTALTLAHEVASHIRATVDDFQTREQLTEAAVFDLVVSLVGSVGTSDRYALQFHPSGEPLARDYFNFNQRGALMNAFFASIQTVQDEMGTTTEKGAMSTDLFIKQGGADCRGTNSIYASLLNQAYQTIGSAKEARILYVKVRDGDSAEAFARCQPADHNIVLVQSEPDQPCQVMDAFFANYHNRPLSDLVRGDVESGFAMQICGATPYPLEQFSASTSPVSGMSEGSRSPSFTSSEDEFL